MRVFIRCIILASAAGCGASPGPAEPQDGGNTAGTSVVTVRMDEYAYSPAPLTIAAGTAVRWINDGTLAHTATSDAGTWNSGSLSAVSGGVYGGSTSAGEYRFTFNAPGTYAYHCAFHEQQGMRGTITVTE